MDEHVFDLAALIERYLRNDLSKQEENRLLEILAKDKSKGEILERYRNTADAARRLDRMNRLDVDNAWLRLKNKKHRKQRPWKWFSYAASFLLLLSAGAIFFYYQQDDRIIADKTGTYANDVLPWKKQSDTHPV